MWARLTNNAFLFLQEKILIKVLKESKAKIKSMEDRLAQQTKQVDETKRKKKRKEKRDV